jgi:hypothetical protein
MNTKYFWEFLTLYNWINKLIILNRIRSGYQELHKEEMIKKEKEKEKKKKVLETIIDTTRTAPTCNTKICGK